MSSVVENTILREWNPALAWNPQESRRIVRPLETWRRTILKETKDAGKSWSEIKCLVKNRSKWRRFVEALYSNLEFQELIYIGFD